MNIKILDKNKHLTATNKKHIKALLANNLLEGKVNNIPYILKKLDNNIYLVNIISYSKSVITGKIEKLNYFVNIEIIE